MKRSVIIALSLLLALVACVDETDRYTIPFAPVNFTVDLGGPDYMLKTPLSFLTFTEKEKRHDADRFGFAGLLVVSDATGNALFAYDLCCPYEDSKIIKVVPRSDGTAECPECGSVYYTMYGSTSGHSMYGFGTPEKGPSSEALQRYRVILQNGVYHISN